MSAIWGMVSLSGHKGYNQISHADILMRQIYEEKCRLDRISDRKKQSFYMGCGIQHVTNYAEKELLPIYEEEKGCCFTADCILDNRSQLMQELGIVQADMADGSLMYEAYRRWGMDCVKHFRGLFSLAVYEERDNALFLAADQMSNRCLYYYRRDDVLVFSTLIEPIRRCYPDIRVNELYMKDFLTAPGMMPNIISHETPYEGIYKLNPGTYLKITAQQKEEISYWSPSLEHLDCHCSNASEYGAYFRNLYELCVKDAMNTQGKIAIAMSSGLDSASVGAIAADELAKTGQNLYTYTYVTSEQEIKPSQSNFVLDERKDVEEIIKLHPNMVPHYLNNQGRSCYKDLDKCIDIMEIPIKASVNLPNLCEIYGEAAKEGCKVVLSGQAGNSTVSQGYIDDVLYDLHCKRKYFKLLSYLNKYCPKAGESRKAAWKGCCRYFHYADKVRKSHNFAYKMDNPFLKEAICKDYPLKERYLKGGLTLLEKIPAAQEQYREYLYKPALYAYLGELDTKMGLTYNIVLRDPTRDMRMLQFCYWLPYHLFAYQGVPRWLIRGNLQDLLPDRLLGDWMRYGVQNADWYIRMLRDWDEVEPELRKLPECAGLQEYLDCDKVKDFLSNIREQEVAQGEISLQYLLFICAVRRFYNTIF